MVTTHIGEVVCVRGLKEPLDVGGGGHLAPHLAGDAAQREGFVGHGLRVGVHFHAGPAARRRCRARGARTGGQKAAASLRCSSQVTGFRGQSPGREEADALYKTILAPGTFVFLACWLPMLIACESFFCVCFFFFLAFFFISPHIISYIFIHLFYYIIY